MNLDDLLFTMGVSRTDKHHHREAPLALEDGCGEWHHLRFDRVDTDEDGTSVVVLTVDDTAGEGPIAVQPD